MRNLLLASLLLAAGGPARAATSDGSLITNVISATYFSLNNGAVFGVSYAATATVLVQDPCLKLTKMATPTQQSPGANVVFTICIINCSTTGSAFNITLSDRLPANVSYISPSVATWGGIGSWQNYWAASELGPWTPGEPANGTGSPLYLRWAGTVAPAIALGIGRSACISYTASIQ